MLYYRVGSFTNFCYKSTAMARSSFFTTQILSPALHATFHHRKWFLSSSLEYNVELDYWRNWRCSSRLLSGALVSQRQVNATNSVLSLGLSLASVWTVCVLQSHLLSHVKNSIWFAKCAPVQETFDIASTYILVKLISVKSWLATTRIGTKCAPFWCCFFALHCKNNGHLWLLSSWEIGCKSI